MFPNQDAVNRHLHWTDRVMKFIGISNDARRIVGVASSPESWRFRSAGRASSASGWPSVRSRGIF
jgi:hypothetical protein